MSNYLESIIARKRDEVKVRSLDVDLSELQRQITKGDKDVPGALRLENRIAVIAEHKRKSPSKGMIRENSDPAEIARMYEAAGASAMSVLTDGPGFAGSAEDLQAARAAVSLPILCKDFILTPHQIFEARVWGADFVLLIVAALDPEKLGLLMGILKSIHMTALVEVHDLHEVRVALRAGATMIGVNNRNLHTFEVSLDTSERLIKRIPPEVVRVSESGIRNAADIRRLRDVGFDAVLVGEMLMRAKHPGEALATLIAEAS